MNASRLGVDQRHAEGCCSVRGDLVGANSSYTISATISISPTSGHAEPAGLPHLTPFKLGRVAIWSTAKVGRTRNRGLWLGEGYRCVVAQHISPMGDFYNVFDISNTDCHRNVAVTESIKKRSSKSVFMYEITTDHGNYYLPVRTCGFE